MTHLGSFGAAVRELDPAERDDFDFFGEKFIVVGVIPPMIMLQIGAATTGKIDDQESLGAMWEAMRTSLTAPAVGDDPPDDEAFRRFYRLAVARCCDLEGLLALAMALFEAQSGRPTVPASTSSDGLPGTSTTSNTSSTPSPASPPQHPALSGMTPVASVLGG
ncbi:hypothetical protein Q0Z83_060130 [Actinoplanes sichuanensis]|uniref:Uncharacterized protein n=1 Tax=Actinoplanes sichuanensis TaxID=512349 RepID=A0ABW4A6R8_9ACTN|nr:hypothetical protein [Actinoplanes sichuanensis]BEL07822.1 hypothetical protein Q0Z83_060130 [Actinoplanes sichuanensis]